MNVLLWNFIVSFIFSFSFEESNFIFFSNFIVFLIEVDLSFNNIIVFEYFIIVFELFYFFKVFFIWGYMVKYLMRFNII